MAKLLQSFSFFVLVIQFSGVVPDGTGHHHHHHEDHDHHDDHDPEPSSSYLPPSSHCGHSRDTSTVVNNVGDIDYQMYHVLQSVPLAIQEARSGIIQSTRESNRDKAITGIACLIGAISGGLGVTAGATSPTTAVVLGWLAQHTWGYGYWGPFLLDFEELDPGCGVEDFNKVLGDYSFVTSLYTTYGKDLQAGAYSSHHPDDRPELRAYYLSEFGRKAKHALHCITSKAGSDSSASKVVSLIDKYVGMGLERLSLTETLMS